MQYLHFHKEVEEKCVHTPQKCKKQGTVIMTAPLLLQIYEKNAEKENSVKMTSRLC